MKDKPPFILYSNISKSLNKKVSNTPKFDNPINLIYSRIPEEVLENSQELRKIVYKEKLPVYDVIKLYKKPKEIEISNNMPDQTQKNIENINSFRENFYEFNHEERKLLENFAKYKVENETFGNQYHKIQRIKYRFKSGTYLDHDYLIPIASRYFAKGIRVPKIYTGKSVFSGNPLILSGSELENFVVYNLGDRKKGTRFLEKVEEIVTKKENGNYIGSSQKNVKDNPEQLKGYIPPEILIPKLQDEIETSKNTIKNIDSLEHFFRDKKSKIKIKKNLPAIKRFNKNKKVLNLSNINNEDSNKSMVEQLSPFSNKNFLNIDNSYSKDNSALSNDKSSLFIFSKLPSSPRDKDRFSLINDLYSERNKRKSNLPNINILLKNMKGRFSNINIHNNNSIKNSLKNKSTEENNKILSRNFSFLENNPSINEKIKENNNETEKSELKLSQKKYVKKPTKQTKLKLDLSENNNNSKNDINIVGPRKNKKLKKLNLKKDKIEKNFIKTEKIFNLILNDKNLNKNESEIIKYLKKRGYNTSRKMDALELYKNMDKAESCAQKNLLQDEFKLRGELADTRYKNLLEKNNYFSKQIEENAFKYKKMICEKNISSNID